MKLCRYSLITESIMWASVFLERCSHHTEADRVLATAQTQLLLALCPATSHTSPSTSPAGKHIYAVYEACIVLCCKGTQPVSQLVCHPLCLHYSNTDALAVNISDTDAAEKCWQLKLQSAVDCKRTEIPFGPSQTTFPGTCWVFATSHTWSTPTWELDSVSGI